MAVVLLTVGCATAEKRAEQRKLVAGQVAEAIKNRQLTMEVNCMHTQRYGAHRVTPDFNLTLRGDTLVSYLPFFGRAYGVTYGSPSQGLNFTSVVKNFRQTELKHDAVRMEMDVASQEDNFCYVLDIYPNGKAYLLVRSQERDAMHYDGELVF